MERVMELVDNVKEKLNNKEYLDFCNALKSAYSSTQSKHAYEIEYRYPEIRYDIEQEMFNVFVCSGKTIGYITDSYANEINTSSGGICYNHEENEDLYVAQHNKMTYGFCIECDGYTPSAPFVSKVILYKATRLI